MSRLIAGALIALSLVGCATPTVQVAPTEAKPIAKDRVLLPPQVAQAEIVVVRDKGFMGSACYVGLYVNRQLAARIANEEVVRLMVPAGDLLLSVSHDPKGEGLCGAFMRDYRMHREFRIAWGETKHFRLHMHEQGMDIMRSDF